ncbi:MAG: hypothetical protein AB8G16_00520 [Gammaproteobacteria bacterium]
MTTRQLLISLSALVAVATFSDRANASETTILAAPAAAFANLTLNTATLTPSEPELNRLRKALRADLHGDLEASLEASVHTALNHARVVAD